MSKRRSWFGNFSVESLEAILKQTEEELKEKQSVNNPSLTLKTQIKEAEYLITVLKNMLIKNYNQSNISLHEVTKRLLKTTGIEQEIYKEVFTRKLLEKNELISLDLLTKAMDTLDIEKVSMIMDLKEDTLYGIVARKRYDTLIFDVEDDVYNEYVLKKRMDERRD